MKRFIFFLIALACGIGFSSYAQAMDVTLGWDANSETDLAGYKIYYDEDGAPPFGGTGASNGNSPITVPLSSITPSAPQATVLGLDGLKKYYFAATAYDTTNLESGYSNIVFAGPILYNLITIVSGTGGTISPPSGPYGIGTIQTVTATPNAGYRVKSWLGTNNDASTATTNTVTMTSAKTVTVTFELIPTAPAAPTNLRVITTR